MAFSMVDPYETYMGRWFKVWRSFIRGDQEKIDKSLSNNNWHDTVYNLGYWFLEAMDNHFIGNKLYDGTWIVNGETVDLANITCEMYVFAGGRDVITSTLQAKGILDKVGSGVKVFTEFEDAGHTLVFAGDKQIDEALRIIYER
jgi:poly(3-hydroxyalkanoate) synthetase